MLHIYIYIHIYTYYVYIQYIHINGNGLQLTMVPNHLLARMFLQENMINDIPMKATKSLVF